MPAPDLNTIILADHSKKAKASDSYIARLAGKSDQPRFTIIGSGS